MINTKKQCLFLFTASYPYGNGENFINNELKVLASGFEKIYIFPFNESGIKQQLPYQNVEVVEWKKQLNYKPLKILLTSLFLFLRIYLTEFFSTQRKKIFLRKSGYFRSLLLQNINKSQIAGRYIQKYRKQGNVFYTYWLNDWATVLGILKIRKIVPSFCSRVHGFDLYEERSNDGIIPFRHFQMKTVEQVFTVSDNGHKYLLSKFPNFKHKIKTSYLGVGDNGLNPFEEKVIFTLVSCSSLIPLKRVHLIIEILKNISMNVKWIHLGDGMLKPELLEQCRQLSSNISMDFKGHLDNNEIVSFYRSQPVHLFITTSETEGLPVSIQEAISFGIPVIATNVGGISEIVNEHTGILIEKEFNCKQVADIIINFAASKKNTEVFRKEVRSFWKEKFDAATNYTLFYKQLIKNL